MSRTLLLGLDGATFTLLEPLMAAGEMPFLKRFVDEGVCADLMSTPCPVTPPAWTTVMTGRSPGNHGIFDFIRVDSAITDHVAFRLTNGRDIQCETIWSIASRHGRKAGSLNYPVMFEAPEYNGYLVPGFVTWRMLRTSTRPRDFWDRIKALKNFDPKDAAWDLDEGRKPLGRGLDDKEDFLAWIEYLKRKEHGWFAITKELIEGTDCELIAVVFEGVDRLQHQAWHLLDPAYIPTDMTEWDHKLQDSSVGYYRRLDRMMEELVTAAGEDARTFIVSDHGFGPTTEIFYANVWLEREGLLNWTESTEVDGDGMLTAQNMREHFMSIDWSRTVAYARTTSANGIYIRVAEEPDQVGVRPEDYESVRARIADGLLNWKDPATNEPVVTRVMTREQAFPGQAMNEAPDLTVELRDNGFISIMRGPEILKQRALVKGTHRPNGILIAGGKDIRRGTTIRPQAILDVAPTCLYSMGLAIPQDFEGGPMTDLFEPAFVEANPVESGELTISPLNQAGAEDQAKDEDYEETILERLKALGYLE